MPPTTTVTLLSFNNVLIISLLLTVSMATADLECQLNGTLTSSAQQTQYEDCTTINGNLAWSNGTVPYLPSLLHLNGDLDLSTLTNLNDTIISMSLPSLTSITGDLIILYTWDSIISLPSLVTIDGSVTIGDSTSVDHLQMDSVESIGGNLTIWATYGFSVSLMNLFSVGGTIFISSNSIENLLIPRLMYVGDDFRILLNPLLVTLNVMNDPARGDSYIHDELYIRENIQLMTLNGSFTSLTTIGGDLIIADNPVLGSDPNATSSSWSSFRNLSIHGEFQCTNNEGMLSLMMNHIRAIYTSLYIRQNRVLTTISFSELTDLGELWIKENNALESITLMESLDNGNGYIGGGISFYDNPSLTTLPKFTNVHQSWRQNGKLNGGLQIIFNEAITQTSLDAMIGVNGLGLNTITGVVTIAWLPHITTLSFLSTLVSCNTLRIGQNDHLISFAGLHSLRNFTNTRVDIHTMYVLNNRVLADISGWTGPMSYARDDARISFFGNPGITQWTDARLPDTLIEKNNVTRITLSGIRDAYQLRVRGVGLTSIHFPSLQSIDYFGPFSSNESIIADIEANQLVHIAGNLNLTGEGAIQSLSLPSLTIIAGSLIINSVASLINLSLPMLTTIDDDIEFMNNNKLPTIELPSLIMTSDDITIAHNVKLSDINFGDHNISAARRLLSSSESMISGSVRIYSNPLLTAITSFTNVIAIDGDLFINDNTALEQFDGLSSVRNISGDVYIGNNPQLMNITGLSSLSWCQQLTLTRLGYLQSLAGLESLHIITNGSLTINSTRIETLTGLDQLVSAGSIHIENNNYLTSTIGAPLLSSLTSLTSSLGVTIVSNDILTTINGFESLTSIFSGSVIISSNPLLTSIPAMWHFDEILGDLYIGDNDALVSIDDFIGLRSVGGDVHFVDNDALTSLTGFCSMETIGGGLQLSNSQVCCKSAAELFATITVGGIKTNPTVGTGICASGTSTSCTTPNNYTCSCESLTINTCATNLGCYSLEPSLFCDGEVKCDTLPSLPSISYSYIDERTRYRNGSYYYPATAITSCAWGYRSLVNDVLTSNRTCDNYGIWVGHSVNCTDINECEESPYPCDFRATCINTIGSYECGPVIIASTLTHVSSVDYPSESIPITGPSSSITAGTLQSGGSTVSMLLIVGNQTIRSVTYQQSKSPYHQYECISFVNMSLIGNESFASLECVLEGGYGTDYQFTLHYCGSTGECNSTIGSDSFAYLPPVPTIGSLQLMSALDDIPSSHLVLPSNNANQLIGFVGVNFHTNRSMFHIKYGPVSDINRYECSFIDILSSYNRVICLTEFGLYWNDMTITIYQDDYVIPLVNTTLRYSVNDLYRPVITSVAGCDDNGVITTNCPASGSTVITVSGTNFFEPVVVMVDQQLCTSPIVNVTNVACTLPVSIGLLRNVSVTSGATNLSSVNVPALSYGAPVISSVIGCDQSLPSLTITGCNRQGGDRITINGYNFGAIIANVTINNIGITCNSGDDQQVICTLASNNEVDVVITVTQFGAAGLSSSASSPFLLSYSQCASGTYQPSLTSTDCDICDNGTYSIEGSMECHSVGMLSSTLTAVVGYQFSPETAGPGASITTSSIESRGSVVSWLMSTGPLAIDNLLTISSIRYSQTISPFMNHECVSWNITSVSGNGSYSSVSCLLDGGYGSSYQFIVDYCVSQQNGVTACNSTPGTDLMSFPPPQPLAGDKTDQKLRGSSRFLLFGGKI